MKSTTENDALGRLLILADLGYAPVTVATGPEATD